MKCYSKFLSGILPEAQLSETPSQDGGRVDVPDKPECGIYVYISMLILCYRARRTDCEGLQVDFFDPGNKWSLKCDWLNALIWKYTSGISATKGKAMKGSGQTILNYLLSIHGQNIIHITTSVIQIFFRPAEKALQALQALTAHHCFILYL